MKKYKITMILPLSKLTLLYLFLNKQKTLVTVHFSQYLIPTMNVLCQNYYFSIFCLCHTKALNILLDN